MKNIKNFFGFTLVELIIVITILAILATIGFVSFQNFTKSSRDGNRVATITQLKKGLEIYSTQTGKYPQPEGNVMSGSINNQILTYVGEIGQSISKGIKMNKTPTDPLTQTNLVYGTTKDNKYYQVATIMENPTSHNRIITQTYADSFFQANVEGNYPGYIKFSSGSELWIANIPSLIFNNTGSVNLLSSGTYFVVHKKTNLPYQVNSATQIQNVPPNALIQDITKSANATLTGVNITNLTKDNFETIFTGDTLKSFNIVGIDVSNTESLKLTVKTGILGGGSIAIPKTFANCTLSGQTITHGSSMTAYSENNIAWNANYDCINRSQIKNCNDGILSGSGIYQYTSCVKGTVNNCSASGSYVYNGHTYSIPALNHSSGATNILSSNVVENNGTFKYTLSSITCNDGNYVSPNENSTPTVQSCNTNYGINGNTCSASQNGSCNNAVALGCSIGSALNDNGATTCGTTRTWNCNGLYGGSISAQCSLANPSCQINPSNLTLNHTANNKIFTFSWVAGSGNGGSCKLQYNKNGIWTNISETTYNCDTTLSNQSVTLPGDGWYSGNWNGVQVRVIRTSDNLALGSPFTQTLSCSTTTGSSTSTSNIDEDCNGNWDNIYTNYCTYSGCPSGKYCGVVRNCYMPDGNSCPTITNTQGHCYDYSGSNIYVYSRYHSYSYQWLYVGYQSPEGCGNSRCITTVGNGTNCSYSLSCGTEYR